MTSAAHELDDRPGPLRDYLLGSLAEWFAALERVTQGAIEEGHFRSDLDVKQFVFELYSAYLGFSFVQRAMQDAGARERAARSLERLLDDARA